MKITLRLGTALLVIVPAVFIGCKSPKGAGVVAPDYPPLGTQHDEIMMQQEINAEASKYVVYSHEFDDLDKNGPGWKLTPYGEDHVKQIAVNLQRGDEFPVVLERSEISIQEGTELEYPVHFNEALDRKRRQMLVASLQALGVADADERVVVGPAFAEGITGTEASRAYGRGIRGGRNGSGGGMGGMGGMGGFGGFGGFGGRFQ